jgi:hypothetical protein
MKHESSIALFSAWDRWRGDAQLADPSLVSPADLGALLPDLILIDLAEPDFRFRFSGAGVATRYGRDLQDESFLSIWQAADAAGMTRLLAGIKTRRTGIVAGFHGETAGGGYTAFELLLLPLGTDNACVSAVGLIVRTGGHDDANRLRARLVSQTLVSVRVLESSRPGRPRRLQHPLESQRRVSLDGFRSRYGHLTVIHGGRAAPARVAVTES